MLNKKDKEILRIMQENCKKSTKEIAREINFPISTVHTRIKKLEKEGIIHGYKALVNSKLIGKSATAFILATFSPRENVSQRDVAKRLTKLSGVQEVHIITGEYDILIKIKTEDIESIGKFVIDKMRAIKGIEKTLTCVVFESVKEDIAIEL